MEKIYPTFTIVTPSFNQGQYIEQTITSVLSQAGDFSIQYIIADAGSNDATVTILEKYDDLLKKNLFPIKCNGVTFQYWSRKDKGQSHALNEGFVHAEGRILAWINSDDYYEPGAFQEIAMTYNNAPQANMIYGNGHTLHSSTNRIQNITVPEITYQRLLWNGCELFQPSTFFTRSIFEKVGGIDESFQFVFDYELWIKIAKEGKLVRVDGYLSTFRLWPQSKTSSQGRKFIVEEKKDA